MSGFMLKATVLLCLAHLGVGATLGLSHEHSESVGSSGALVRREIQTQPSETIDSEHLEELIKAKGADMCNDNYVQGAANKSDCKTTLQKKIEEPSMCMEAAREHCPDEKCLGEPFTIDSTYFNHYPSRCFMTEAGKWHFNPAGYEPTALTGRGTPVSYPICVQPEYHNGTAGGDGATTCPEGFAVITHEDTCRTAATCLALCPEERFNVVNGTDDTPAPLGCHINPEDGCVKFNTIKHTGVVTGTPLCNLTLARGTEDKSGGSAATTAADASGTTAAATP